MPKGDISNAKLNSINEIYGERSYRPMLKKQNDSMDALFNKRTYKYENDLAILE
jgi:hypothetical protein